MNEETNRWDDLPIEKLGLPARAYNVLKRNGIDRLSLLKEITLEGLLEFRGMGKTTAEEILRARNAAYDGQFLGSQENHPALGPQQTVLLYDVPLEELSLSNRAAGALKRSGYDTLSKLLKLAEKDLMKIPNLGSGSVQEIVRVREEQLAQHSINAEMAEQEQTALIAASESLSSAFGLTKSEFLRHLLSAAKCETKAENVLAAALSVSPLSRALDHAIQLVLEQHEEGISLSELTSSLRAVPPESLRAGLDRLSERGVLRFDDGVYKRFYPSVSDFVASVTDERARSFLEQRLAGKTLEEVGTANDMTRERVRQICNKALSMRPRLYEDKYRAIYEHYEWSREDFRLAFGEPDATFLYLQMAYRHGTSPIAQVLTDEEIPAKLRRRAERAVYKNDVFIDGVRLHRDRQTLVRHAVRRYCTEQTRFETFLGQYQEMLDALELGDDPKLVISARTYENHFLNCDYALWVYPKTLRAYPIDEVDAEAFLEALCLERYRDTTISAEILFRENPELMQENDIRDAYELHNLLRKLYPKDQTLIQFGRQPMITIGRGDLQSQLLDLLLQYAPITAEELAKKCREHFGILEQTAMGSYFRDLDEYYHDGLYRIDADNLSPERYAAMQSALPGDLYSIQRIRRVYKQLFPQANDGDINPYTLKTLGFRVYSGYVVRNSWANARAYFTNLILEPDVADLREMDSSIFSHVSFTSTLYDLKAAREIVEFAPRQFVTIRRLEENGVTRADLEDYCEKAAAFAEPGRFFTVTSLRNAGFRHPLDELGFDEWFYSSVLIEDRAHFSYRRYGKSKLLYSGARDVQLKDFLAELVEREPMELYDLLELLQNEYGLIFGTEKVLQAVRDSELYYDPIMEKLYPDYDTYYEEI